MLFIGMEWHVHVHLAESQQLAWSLIKPLYRDCYVHAQREIQEKQSWDNIDIVLSRADLTSYQKGLNSYLAGLGFLWSLHAMFMHGYSVQEKLYWLNYICNYAHDIMGMYMGMQDKLKKVNLEP